MFNVLSMKLVLPCILSVIAASGESCAVIMRGDRSVTARSTSCTCPVRRPGKASRLLEELGLREHNPRGFILNIPFIWTNFMQV